MKETIYYVSNIKWFSYKGGKYKSKQEALKKHIEYVVKSKDYRFGIGDKKKILERSKLADKRKNSRIAFSLTIAIPNDLDYNKTLEHMKKIREIIAETFKMNEKDILICFHDSIGISKEKNKHVHVVGVNIDKNGKALRVDRETLKEMHKKLQQLLIDANYTIKKDKGRQQHIGTKIRYNDEIRNKYLQMLENKKKQTELVEQEKREKEKEKEREKLKQIQQSKSKIADINMREIIEYIRYRMQKYKQAYEDKNTENNIKTNKTFRPKM